jgi:hypothetical protein
MAMKVQGGRMIPANDNSGAAARNASAKLINIASSVDEVVRTLKRDGSGDARIAALASELDSLRSQLASASKKLSAVR